MDQATETVIRDLTMGEVIQKGDIELGLYGGWKEATYAIGQQVSLWDVGKFKRKEEAYK